jgi:hypothetical protein
LLRSADGYRIDPNSVSLILQSCLGGVAKDFYVPWLCDWCFRFSVSYKKVGLMIHHLDKVVGKHYTIHFSLWQNGSLDWVWEHSKWAALEAMEWHLASHARTLSRKSYADVVKTKVPIRVSSSS